ncbi:cortex morphogenetic protein CmpA [Amphibacillus sediminis]|nr:cortex morphogenetic protein CmpA [Amphibacillus sediminis]
MPTWLKRQLTYAFKQKDINQIIILNQCWFFYHSEQG